MTEPENYESQFSLNDAIKENDIHFSTYIVTRLANYHYGFPSDDKVMGNSLSELLQGDMVPASEVLGIYVEAKRQDDFKSILLFVGLSAAPREVHELDYDSFISMVDRVNSYGVLIVQQDNPDRWLSTYNLIEEVDAFFGEVPFTVDDDNNIILDFPSNYQQEFIDRFSHIEPDIMYDAIKTLFYGSTSSFSSPTSASLYNGNILLDKGCEKRINMPAVAADIDMQRILELKNNADFEQFYYLLKDAYSSFVEQNSLPIPEIKIDGITENPHQQEDRFVMVSPYDMGNGTLGESFSDCSSNGYDLEGLAKIGYLLPIFREWESTRRAIEAAGGEVIVIDGNDPNGSHSHREMYARDAGIFYNGKFFIPSSVRKEITSEQQQISDLMSAEGHEVIEVAADFEGGGIIIDPNNQILYLADSYRDAQDALEEATGLDVVIVDIPYSIHLDTHFGLYPNGDIVVVDNWLEEASSMFPESDIFSINPEQQQELYTNFITVNNVVFASGFPDGAEESLLADGYIPFTLASLDTETYNFGGLISQLPEIFTEPQDLELKIDGRIFDGAVRCMTQPIGSLTPPSESNPANTCNKPGHCR